jgi:sirohydrochlorin cobaltochelatase
MPRRILSLLREKLDAGSFTLGQIRIHPDFSLHHNDDDPADPSLEVHTDGAVARRLAFYDMEGKYRPLKTAPNLRRGWKLQLTSIEELRLTLDMFYPAALGLWASFLEKRLTPTPWRDTVNRQTGMYRIVGLITDEQSETLISSTCQSETGCLRHLLWSLEPGHPHSLTESDPAKLLEKRPQAEIPLLCAEACNLLVAAGRPVVKAARAAAEEAAKQVEVDQAAAAP